MIGPALSVTRGMAAPARVSAQLEARPSIGGSVLTVRLGDLKEVVLAGSNVPPLMSRHAHPAVGARRQQVADTHLFLHTFARAWGLESVEPVPGGVRITILLLPAPEPPVVQAAIGRATLELRDCADLAEAWIDPLEPTLEVLQTRDHSTARKLPRPARPPAPRKRKDRMLQAPRVLTGSPPAHTPAWKRRDVWAALVAFGLGAAGLAELQQSRQSQARAQAWTQLVQSAELGAGLQPQVTVAVARTAGGLPTASAGAAMDVLQLEAGRCYVDTLSLLSDPLSLAGEYTARVTFRSGGRVMAVDGPSATFDDPELSACIGRAARSLVVGDAPAGASLDVALRLSPT